MKSVFAAVALAIAVVGVAGVLAFSVSARTREFGIRLALGSQPRDLLRAVAVIMEGALMAAAWPPYRSRPRLRAGGFGRKIFPGRENAGRSSCVRFCCRSDDSCSRRLNVSRSPAARVDVMQALRSE
jgi:putative ABC transport system permease protein